MASGKDNGHVIPVMLSLIAETKREIAEIKRETAEIKRETAELKRANDRADRRLRELEEWREEEDVRMRRVAVLLEATARALKSLDIRVTDLESDRR